jgi:heme/copper-type cytochrome/quinol oxidase subunit 3
MEGATVTYAHYSLIQGTRRGAILGTRMTLLFAILLTIFQGIAQMLDLLLQMVYTDQHSSSQQDSTEYMCLSVQPLCSLFPND